MLRLAMLTLLFVGSFALHPGDSGFLALGLAFAGACAVHATPRYGQGGGVRIFAAPPPLRVEVASPPPAADYTWIGAVLPTVASGRRRIGFC